MWGSQGEKYIVYTGKHLSLPHKSEFAQYTFLKHTTAVVLRAKAGSVFSIQQYYRYVKAHNTFNI